MTTDILTANRVVNFLRAAAVTLVFVSVLTAGTIRGLAQSTVAVEIVNDSIIVDVGLGHGRSARLLLDTGAQTTTFSRSAAERLALPTSKPSETDSLFAGIGTFDKLDIGTLSADNVPFGVLKLKNSVWDHIHADHGAVDGSLGIDLLSRFVIGVDMPGRTLTIWNQKEFDGARAQRWFNYLQVVPGLPRGTSEAALKACEIPTGADTHFSPPDTLDIWLPPQSSLVIGEHAYRNVVHGIINPVKAALDRRENGLFTVRGELDGSPFVFDFDTGSNRLTLPPGFSDIFKPIVEMPGAQLSAIDTTETVKGCIYRSVQISGYEIRFPYALAATGHSAYTRNPTLGMGLFSDCKLLLDFPGREIMMARIAPNADAPRKKLAALGIFLVETDGKAHLYVGKGSPGERVGLHDGDGLVRCEGLPPAQPDEAISVKQADQDRPVAITVRHAGESTTQTVTFDRESDGIWLEQEPIATFPPMPDGYTGAKRFPTGGVYVDSQNIARLIRPGGSVLLENGAYSVAYHDIRTKSFGLNLPRDKFQIIPAKREPGTPPAIAKGMGLVWIGGIGWVVGPSGARIQLDGFTITLRPSPTERSSVSGS